MRFCLIFFTFMLLLPLAAIAEDTSMPMSKEECVEFYDKKMAEKEEAEKNHEEEAIKKLEDMGKTKEAYELAYRPYMPLFELAEHTAHCVQFDKRYFEIQKRFCSGYLSASDEWRKFMDNLEWSFPFCEEALERGDDGTFLLYVQYYLRGLDGQKDYAAAIKLIDKFTSMHAENEDLIFLKAPIYRLGGYGVEKDEKKAFEIWKYISEKYKEKINGAGAACQLSLYYRDGRRILYISTHQSPFYPGTGRESEKGTGNILNIELPASTNGAEYSEIFSRKVIPALENFKPELLLVSAGFDAHKHDPLAGLNLSEEDFAWIGQQLSAFARNFCHGHVVSMLEGGYNHKALANSVVAYLSAFA